MTARFVVDSREIIISLNLFYELRSHNNCWEHRITMVFTATILNRYEIGLHSFQIYVFELIEFDFVFNLIQNELVLRRRLATVFHTV